MSIKHSKLAFHTLCVWFSFPLLAPNMVSHSVCGVSSYSRVASPLCSSVIFLEGFPNSEWFTTRRAKLVFSSNHSMDWESIKPGQVEKSSVSWWTLVLRTVEGNHCPLFFCKKTLTCIICALIWFADATQFHDVVLQHCHTAKFPTNFDPSVMQSRRPWTQS